MEPHPRVGRLRGRQWADYTGRYPELEILRRLPARTLVDGELVVIDPDSRSDLPRLLRRHGLTDPSRIRQVLRWCLVCYVVFDVIYDAGRCLLHELLLQRREMLVRLCQRLDTHEVKFSAGVVGHVRALYAAAMAHDHEGGRS
jgi:ATP-dependent DNA ligase